MEKTISGLLGKEKVNLEKIKDLEESRNRRVARETERFLQNQ